LTSGNPILDKNLECIEKYNPQLSDKLLNLACLTNQIELGETELKEPNLLYNGFPLHSMAGAELEAKKAINDVKNTPTSLHIIFGMGLGYLFKEFCENSQGLVFLYEPNLEILRVTLELVDFSKELSQKNVFLTSDIGAFRELYIPRFLYGSTSSFLALNSYRNIYKDTIEETIRQIKVVNGSVEASFERQVDLGFDSIMEIFKNSSYMLDATPLDELKDIYKGKTALIVAAGPTLDLNLETIKKNRDKVVIFCVGTAYKALAGSQIVPDFVNIIEPLDCSGQVLGHDLSQINMISSPVTNNSIHTLKVKHHYLLPSFAELADMYWCELTNYESKHIVKGSVSYAAIESARTLGFSKIILVGQDLAYVNNRCYSSGSAYKDLVFDVNQKTDKIEVKMENEQNYLNSYESSDKNLSREKIEQTALDALKTIQETSYLVKGVTGEMLPSKSAMASFVQFFKEFAYENKDLELINTSMIGAQIDGFENIPLEKALENEPVVERVSVSIDFKYDKQKFLNNLERDLHKLKALLAKFKLAKTYMSKYEELLKTKHIMNPELIELDKKLMDVANVIKKVPNSEKIMIIHKEALEKKRGSIPQLKTLQTECIQRLLLLYKEIDNERSNSLYIAISCGEKLEIDYVFREYQNLNQMELVIIYSALKDYFEKVNSKLLKIVDEVSLQVEKLRENINASVSV